MQTYVKRHNIYEHLIKPHLRTYARWPYKFKLKVQPNIKPTVYGKSSFPLTRSFKKEINRANEDFV